MERSTRTLSLYACLLTVGIAAHGAISIPPADEVLPPTSGTRVDLNREKIETIRDEIESDLASASSAQQRSVLEQQLDALDRAMGLIDAFENPETPPAIDPPYSLRDLDRTLKRQQATEERVATLERAVGTAEQSLERASAVLDDTRRMVDDGAANQAQLWEARERVRLARFELRNARTELAVAVDGAERLAAAAEAKRARLTANPADLRERLSEYEDLRQRLLQKRENLSPAIRRAKSALQAAEEQPAAASRRAALEADLATLERQAELFDGQAHLLTLLGDGWTLRYRLASGELERTSDKNAARRRLAAALSEVTYEQEAARARRERLAAERGRVQGDLRQAEDAARRVQIESRLGSLETRIEAESDHVAWLTSRRADLERWHSEFSVGGVAENVRFGVTALSDQIWSLWNFEITTVDDRPITVGKLVLALVLVLAGVVVSRLLARQLRRRVLDRLSMDASLAASLQTLFLYVMVLLFFLTALRFVNIPLTALTFIGGALAIGIGFGSQNIVNNFISGLILMAERPIKVGDMIEVNGTYGRVERIGGRSTRVRSGDNTHVIVPNSIFLEREVLNWTLSDTTLRTYVDVGVAYGSPTREVARLIERSVTEHGQILKRPEPEVLFTGFGDNALQFRVYFWITVRQILDRLRIQSDVRYKIDQLFRDAEITIAFPQRDVHVDVVRPIDVRIDRPRGDSGNEAE